MEASFTPIQWETPESQMHISVSDAQKHGDGTSPFVTFQVESGSFSVRRRFQDFVNLQQMLSTTHPACIVPPLPDKHRMEYLTGDRFSPEFLEKRRISLQNHLDRLSRHPVLRESKVFLDFLKEPIAPNPSLTKRESKVFDSLSDTLMNVFTKVKKPNERFLETREIIDKLEQSLSNVEKNHSRLLKLQKGFTKH